MKISDLKKNPQNPRIISEAKKAMLKKSMENLGDISGIIYNRKSKTLTGGHQRQDGFDPEDKITIVKKYTKPTKQGTLGEGFIDTKFGRFSYREVWWSKAQEKAAMIAANKGAGEWDEDILEEILADLYNDADFDFDLTMFDEPDLKDFKFDFGSEADFEAKEKELDENIATDKECPSCGYKW